MRRMAYDRWPHERRRALLRVLWLVVLVELIGMATGLAIATQARRTDAPPADAALVLIHGNDGDQLRLDRAQQLWSSGNVSRVVVGGHDVRASSDYLVQRGVQASAVMPIEASSDAVVLADTQRALAEAQLLSVIVIAEPSEMLRMLKMTRDTGLQPRSMPLGARSSVAVGELALEVMRYFRYVLAGE